jgi:hypothetical protein
MGRKNALNFCPAAMGGWLGSDKSFRLNDMGSIQKHYIAGRLPAVLGWTAGGGCPYV